MNLLVRNSNELELIQPHMAQKPVLRGEVGCACVAREVSVEREEACTSLFGSRRIPSTSCGLELRHRPDAMNH